jgi:hypothetical protein
MNLALPASLPAGLFYFVEAFSAERSPVPSFSRHGQICISLVNYFDEEKLIL